MNDSSDLTDPNFAYRGWVDPGRDYANRMKHRIRTGSRLTAQRPGHLHTEAEAKNARVLAQLQEKRERGNRHV